MLSNSIFRAIHENNVFNLSSLFVQYEQNVKIFNKPNKFSITPLILSISLDRLECIKTLIDIGVDVNKADGLQNTPLHIACMDGKHKIIKLLLDAPKIDMNALNCFNECPLLSACSSNNIDCVQTLLDYNAYQHRRDNKGNNAIHIASEYGNIEIIQLLLNRGVLINCRNAKGKTPLYVACVEKQLKAVNFLLERGADANIPDGDGRTPLLACDDSKIKQILRKFGGLLSNDSSGTII
jgi:ankyrin repeat protein